MIYSVTNNLISVVASKDEVLNFIEFAGLPNDDERDIFRFFDNACASGIADALDLDEYTTVVAANGDDIWLSFINNGAYYTDEQLEELAQRMNDIGIAGVDGDKYSDVVNTALTLVMIYASRDNDFYNMLRDNFTSMFIHLANSTPGLNYSIAEDEKYNVTDTDNFVKIMRRGLHVFIADRLGKIADGGEISDDAVEVLNMIADLISEVENTDDGTSDSSDNTDSNLQMYLEDLPEELASELSKLDTHRKKHTHDLKEDYYAYSHKSIRNVLKFLGVCGHADDYTCYKFKNEYYLILKSSDHKLVASQGIIASEFGLSARSATKILSAIQEHGKQIHLAEYSKNASAGTATV